MTYDLVIRGGTLVTAAETIQADLAINGEQIAAIGRDLLGERLLDARGKLVIPGGVDPHVHLQMPQGATVSSDNWETGTIAAAHGGTTTVIDFVEPEPGETLIAAYEKRRAEADGTNQPHNGAVIDYGLHMTLSQPALDHLDEVPDCVAAGMTSFKTYTTYEGMKLTDAEMLRAMAAVRDARGLMLTHCENDAIIQSATQHCRATGPASATSHPRSRPDIAEREAIQRQLTLANHCGVPLYIVHVSTSIGAEIIATQRLHTNLVYAETCPQYVWLDDTRFDAPDFESAKFICSPPLRGRDIQRNLLHALLAGNLQTIGTDHCPFNFVGQKDLGRDDFTRIPGGLPGVEARLALMHHLLSGALNRWVEVCCTNPAKIFGLYPRKGTLMPGADADIVIFDPAREVTITHDLLHENVDYTPYEGITVHGWPETTLSRGAIIVQHGEFMGAPGRGCYLKRQPFPARSQHKEDESYQRI